MGRPKLVAAGEPWLPGKPIVYRVSATCPSLTATRSLMSEEIKISHGTIVVSSVIPNSLCQGFVVSVSLMFSVQT